MGINTEKHIKFISFDLSEKALKERFSNNTREPYSLIKKFFLKNGFEHRQYSGYISLKPLSSFKLNNIIKKMGKELSWIKDCIIKFDVANVSSELDLSQTIIKEATKENKALLSTFQAQIKSYQKSKPALSSSLRAEKEANILKLFDRLKKDSEITFNDKDLRFINSLKSLQKSISLNL